MSAFLKTTSRSESENSFFGRYIHRSLTLVEFFFGFNSAMDLQRLNRVQLYRESRSSVPTLISTQKLEKHASETFSYPVFKKFQYEMSDSAYGCAIQSINEDETGRMYIINDVGRNTSRMTLIALRNSMITYMSMLRSMLRLVVSTEVHRKTIISGLFCKCHIQQIWWSITLDCQETKIAVREFEVPEKSEKPLRSCGYYNEC
ncbi:hypothetical protein QQ045_000810 [Rhodiola kirilowii]